MKNRDVVRALFVVVALGLTACDSAPTASDGGSDAGRVDAGALDGSVNDAGADSSVNDAGAVDGGETDAGAIDAGTIDGGGSDAAMPDGGLLDASAADAGPEDGGVSDGGVSDGGVSDGGVSDGGPTPLPASCSGAGECGALAACDTDLGVCVCAAAALPCGDGCCPLRIDDEVMVADDGQRPEIGSTLSDTYIASQNASGRVTLARIDETTGELSASVVTDGSGQSDNFDLVVSPDGTQHLVVHAFASGRSGILRHYERAGTSGTFTASNALPAGPATFAFGTATSLVRTAAGDLYATTTRRVGDGQMGLLITRRAPGGEWTFQSQLLITTSWRFAELFDRAAGFTIVAQQGSGSPYNVFDLDPSDWSADSLVAGTDRVAADVRDDDVLFTYAFNRVRASDGSVDDTLPRLGAWTDIDMAIDADGNPAVAYHNATTNHIVLRVRMPGGGYTLREWPESIFAPSGGLAQLTVDLERLANGDLGLAVGGRTTNRLTFWRIAR